MTLSFGYWLLVYAAIAIIALIVLIARYRLNPFIVITLVSIGLALLAGMPPSGVVGAYEAGVGKTLGHIALVVALGTMLGKMMAESGGAEQVARTLIDREPRDSLPGFGITMATILLPVVLMLIGGWANLIATPGSGFNQFLLFIGNSVIALLLATLLSFWTLGIAQGFNRESILKFTNECLAPTASITLLVGAGGGLNRILVDAGVTDQIVSLAHEFHLSPLIMGWLFAALMRIATGSATVAMTTASGIVAPVAIGLGYPHPELLVLATGAGSVIFSHVNDGGFWLIKEYFNMTVAQTFKTWTVLETIISLVAFALTVGLSYLI